ncbi:MAG: (2Fe-2S)-binding protein [Syntrophales bacterium]|jgi:predicted molibdopterin-dependent oxidoreductase YjgC|nr:(2Fe-2S)-binding protein [Syntrophales bacterium]
MRVVKHPILGDDRRKRDAAIIVDGNRVDAITGEPIAAALMAAGIRKFRVTPRFGSPRGLFCGIGRCIDCVMTVDGQPNVRTCVTPVKDGMIVETQTGLGKWADEP